MPPQEDQKKRPGHDATGLPNCWEDGPAAIHPPSGPVPAAWLQARLRELQALLAAGLISAQEYEALREKALQKRAK